MKRTNLPSLFAALSLLSLVTLFMPTQALMASEAASALVPEGQRKTVYSGVGENTSGEETDEGEDDQQPPPESPLTKTRRQLTEQDTYFAAKIRTMTSTTYNLRKELCVANDALAQEKRLTQQQVIRLGELEPLVARNQTSYQQVEPGSLQQQLEAATTTIRTLSAELAALRDKKSSGPCCILL